MQLDGTLDTFPLRELIEMIVYSSVTGVLELHTGADIGQLFFRDGQPYHATANEQVGVDAVAAMFEERAAPFRFVADRESADSTLWIDPWDLIDRAEAQAGRWAAVRARIPSIDCVPALRGGSVTGQIQISEHVWPVLSVVDGQRSVREISAHLNWVLLDTCLALLGLIDRDLIAIRPARPVVRRVDPRSFLSGTIGAQDTPDAPEHRSEPGFLERLLAEAQAKEQRPPLTDDETQDGKRVYRYVDDRR